MTKRYVFTSAAMAVAAAIAGMYLARVLMQPVVGQLESGTALPEPASLAAFSLVDTRGAATPRRNLRGHPTLVVFGFTHCPDVCPTTLALAGAWCRSSAARGQETRRPRGGPHHRGSRARSTDSSASSISSFGGDFIGLTGSPPEIVKAQKSFGVAASRVDLAGGSYTMDHSATVFMLDSQARRVAVFTPPLRSEALMRDLRKLAPSLGAGS